MSVYLLTLPGGYIRDLAQNYRACSQLLSDYSPPQELKDNWELVRCFLISVGIAAEELEVGGCATSDPLVPGEITPYPSGLVRFDRLAELLRPDGVGVLLAAANAVGRHLLPDAINLDLSKTEMQWLEDLSQGVTNIELGEKYGMSRRTTQRSLRGLCERLGVEKREQAITIYLSAKHGPTDT